ncbi:RICIN domain-containing protein [Candidatus Halobeggiatoa sp. HSG11]|nr:RICIN domain-containing protein [Candidatus Halobeggiatoa sp. HSG11]
MEYVLALIAGVIGFVLAYQFHPKLKEFSEQLNNELQQRQQLEKSLEDSKQELTTVSENLTNEQQQRQQLEKSLEDSKQELTTASEKLTNEQQQRQQLEKSLESSKQELTTASENLANEQKQRQQLEQSLEDSKREMTTASENLANEQQQRQQLEQSLEKSKQELEESKRELATASESLTTKHQQLEQSLEESKQESISLSKQLHDEQQQSKKLESSLETARKKMTELSQQFEDSKSNYFQSAKIYSIKSINNGKFLDVPKGSAKNNTPISQDDWNGGKNQQWYFQPLGGEDNEYYHIFSVKTKKCLGISTSDDKEGILNQYQCCGTDNQKWKLVTISENNFAIQCKQNDLMLEVSKKTTKIIQQKPHDDDSQQWELTEL